MIEHQFNTGLREKAYGIFKSGIDIPPKKIEWIYDVRMGVGDKSSFKGQIMSSVFYRASRESRVLTQVGIGDNLGNNQELLAVSQNGHFLLLFVLCLTS